MTADPSLARRVVLHLFVAQITAFVIGAMLTMGLELAKVAYFRTSLDEFATYRVSNLVKKSLNQGNGELFIAPIPELRSEIERAPGMKFAVFDELRHPLKGSSPELAAALAKAGVIQMTAAHLHFNLPGDVEINPLGYMERRWTPYGWLHVAVYRQKFRWDDVFGYLLDAASWMAVYLTAIVLLSAVVAWYAVRKGLSPLHDAAMQVEAIDFDNLDRNIIAQAVPMEVRPFVNAINDALARLNASVARMRRYIANAAHELRTPLAIMRARLEDTEEPTFRQDLLRDASHLQAIVEQMLISTRLTERQASVSDEVDLIVTIRQIVADYTPLIIECDRNIELDAVSDSIVVHGNRRAIECVVGNLIDNALRAEPARGKVKVQVSEPAIVSVADHGSGIDPSDRESIFEPFWRRSDATPGTGLGLAISKELMDKLGGSIWVEETPGGGATFKLSFKKAERVEASAPL
jgi:signal transduction histidine kinase